MSRRQRARNPLEFPRMKYRAAKRDMRRAFGGRGFHCCAVLIWDEAVFPKTTVAQTTRESDHAGA